MTAQQDSSGRATSPPPRATSPAAPTPARSHPDLPRVPRRYGQWAAAVLFVLVTVLAAGWMWQQRSDREEVLAVGIAVPAGSVVERGDLQVQEVAGVDAAIAAADVDGIVGSTAAVSLVPGQVLNPDMLTGAPVPGPGERVVGVELDATRSPGGLMPGDSVTVLAVPPSGDPGSPDELESPAVLAETVTLLNVATVQGVGTRLTLVVPQASANTVAAFGSAGRVAVVQAPVEGDR